MWTIDQREQARHRASNPAARRVLAVQRLLIRQRSRHLLRIGRRHIEFRQALQPVHARFLRAFRRNARRSMSLDPNPLLMADGTADLAAGRVARDAHA